MRLLPSEGTAQYIGRTGGAWDSFFPWSGCAAASGPNKGMEPTRRSARLMPGVRLLKLPCMHSLKNVA